MITALARSFTIEEALVICCFGGAYVGDSCSWYSPVAGSEERLVLVLAAQHLVVLPPVPRLVSSEYVPIGE